MKVGVISLIPLYCVVFEVKSNDFRFSRDVDQMLLVHRPRRSTDPLRVRPNAEKIILLVPELCYLTGLTDGQRADTR